MHNYILAALANDDEKSDLLFRFIKSDCMCACLSQKQKNEIVRNA